jgi:putative heme-binding domain-containing protein
VGRGDPNARIKVERTGTLVDVGARDFRFSLDFKTLQPQLGMSQFGRNRDDFGNWFGCNNNTPLFHIVHDDAMLARNPHLTPHATTVFVPQAAKPGPVFAISEKGRFYHESEVGRFTSANSAMIYRDSFLGNEFYGNFFVSEPVHNLVHREMVTRQGVSFTSRRADDEQRSEFLASRDTWFRPNAIRTGPDGALYISDMYREIVEHPAWIAPEKRAGLTFRAGDDRGRIYRIVPEGKPTRTIPRIDKLKPLDVARLLTTESSGELRDMAQRWIVFHQLKTVVPDLQVATGIAPHSGARIQSLWTTEQLGGLTLEQVSLARGDADPAVRAAAIPVTLTHAKQSPEWLPLLGGDFRTKAGSESDSAVQLQIAYALGDLPVATDVAEAPLLLLARTDDPFVIEAVLSSISPTTIERQFSPELIAAYAAQEPARIGDRLLPRLAPIAAGFKKSKTVTAIIAHQLSQVGSASNNSLARTLAELAKHDQTAAELRKSLDATTIARLEAVIRTAQETALDSKADLQSRLDAIALLGRDIDRASDLTRLVSLLGARVSPDIQIAALEQLTLLGDPTVPTALVARWREHAPALRAQIVDSLLTREAWTAQLLTALESGPVFPTDLDATRRQRLIDHPSQRIKARASKLLVVNSATDRRELLTQWQNVLTLPADAARAKDIFAKRCAACHKWQGVGENVGPDLNTLTDRSPKSLLTAILDPNQAVEPKYQSYSVVTDDGKVFVGMIVEETATAITLADAAGKQTSVPRAAIDEFRATGKSLMPEGMERELTQQEAADLLRLLARP